MTFTLPTTGTTPKIADKTAFEAAINAEFDGKLDIAAKNSASFACTTGGTADSITLTNSLLGASPQVGQRLLFKATADNTGASPTISLNGGSEFNLRLQTGGIPSAGMIKANYHYEAIWQGAPSNTWRLVGVADQIYSKATQAVLIPSAVGGSANAIAATTDFAAVNGSILVFKAISTSTNVNVTLSVNGAAGTNIRRADGNPLEVGDIVAGRWYMVRLDATGGNPWVLMSSGLTLGDLAAVSGSVGDLSARVDAVEAEVGSGGSFTTEARALMEKINGPVPSDAAYATSPRNPNTFFTWTDGLRSQAAAGELKVLNFGCSSDTDLHAGKSPSALAITGLTNAFGYLRNLEFTRTNRAVGGAFLNEYLAQIQGAAAGDFDIVMGGQLTNSASIGALAGANDFDNYRGQLLALFSEIRDVRNAMPIYIGCYHNHVDYPQSFPSNYRSTWPDGNQTYQVTGTHEFDAAGGRVKMINLRLYGYTLAAGSKISFASGAGAGVYTIDTIDWDTNWINFVEAIPHTGSYSVLAKHVEVDGERVIWPSNSDLLVTRDRTGNGVPQVGWRTTDMVNQRTQQVCDEAGVMFWDMQKAQYLFMEKKLSENPTWTTTQLFDSVFNWVSPTGVQFNHPNEEFFEWVGQRFVGQFTTAIEDGRLHKSRVIW